MPLRFPEPPAAVADAIGDRRAERLAPQPVFTAGLDTIVATGGEIERAVTEPTSWRSSAGGRAFDIVVDREAARVLSEGDDRFSSGIETALSEAVRDRRVAARDYEVRLLRIPALNLLVVWLHTPGAPDLYAAPDRVYEADEFRALLQERAGATQAHYAEAEDPDELGG